ncbi:MAG TPA: branched-chain amino acid ABC transporter permease [Stellaceae bacterium]
MRLTPAAAVAATAAAVAALVAAPFWIYPVFLTQVLCFALFASAFNLLFGYAGLLSFGHAAFFGSGAYATALVMKSAHASPLLAILAGGGAGALLGALIGGFAIRRQGVYLAMITLAFAEVVYFVALQSPFTGGEDGLQGVPSGTLLGLVDLDDPVAMYFFTLAVYLGGLAMIWRAIRSPFGHVLRAIRENEPRAVSLGYAVQRYKLLAFVLSGGLSGIAGGLKTVAFHFAALSDVYWQTSGDVILMTLLGGAGTLAGPTVGALLVITISDSLAFIGEWVKFILGAVFIACILLFRRGIVGELVMPRLVQGKRSARPSGARRFEQTDSVR